MASTLIIGVGISLLAFAAGTGLLAKVNREALGLLYKIAAWFIIVASLGNLACSAMHCMMGFYGKHMMYEMMEKKMEKNMHKGAMMEHMWHHGEGEEMEDERDGYGKMEHCCMPPMNAYGDEHADYWKMRYGQLKDSCARNMTTTKK